jgi:hypothetical protein
VTNLVKTSRWRRCRRGLFFSNKWRFLLLWIYQIMLLLLPFPLTGRGGMERGASLATICSDGGGGGVIKLNYVGHSCLHDFLCRHGGVLATSGEEALLRSRSGRSKRPSGEVIHSTQLGGGPRQKIVIGRGLPSSWSLFLGGDAWRTPARCGGDARGLHCWNILYPRVLCVKRKPLSLDRRFSRDRTVRAFLHNVSAMILMEFPGSF